jgi:transposase
MTARRVYYMVSYSRLVHLHIEPYPMFVSLFAALLPGLDLIDLEMLPDGLTMTARSTTANAACPHCGHLSSHVHSYYTRAPRDLPFSDQPVRLLLHVRRFRCPNTSCPAATFAERLDGFVLPSAQRTVRLRQALQHLGLARGGAAGARTSQRLHMSASRDTLLRLVRQLPEPPIVTPRVLGVDDFALRKGQRYGTILLDLEQRRPIDLLPERSATVLETWLQQHPGVEIIARDRGPEYIRGATAGAPQAIQVADRFHLLSNLREALERTLEHSHASLRTRFALTPPAIQALSPSTAVPVRRRVRTGVEASMPAKRRARRLALYQTVRLLYQQGKSKRHIAQELQLSPWLVRRFVEADQFPERAPKSQRRTTILTPFEPVLQEQWQQGQRTVPSLFRLLQAEGYSGSIYTVRHWVQQRRHQPAPHTKGAYRARYIVAPEEVAMRAAEQRRLGAARQLVWLLINDPEDLTVDDQELLKFLLEEPNIATIYPLGQQFLQLVRERDHRAFDGWLSACVSSNVPELTSFASGLQQDEAAVRAALTLPWSTGQVEGQITRLKLVKRQMYGRASFDLLRQRVLHAA